MLTQLAINNIVLIEKSILEFDSGLTTITGETGAGKSIVLDALSLALGARADSSLVRIGAEKAIVNAVFKIETNHPALTLCEEQGIDTNDGFLVLSRHIGTDKKSKAFLNQTPVSITFLSSLSRLIIEIHGQFDDQQLMSETEHTYILDSYGNLDDIRYEVNRLWEKYKQSEKALLQKQAAIEQAQKEADYIQYVLKEIEALSPQEGEEDALSSRRQQLMAVEKNASKLGDLIGMLQSAGGESIEGLVLNTIKQLAALESDFPNEIPSITESFNTALTHLSDGVANLERFYNSMEFNPNELEKTEERLFALRALARKHHVQMSDLSQLMEQFRQKRNDLEQGEAALARLEKEKNENWTQYEQKAFILSDKRQQIAPIFSAKVTDEIQQLKLEKARFNVSVTEGLANSNGLDKVIFEVSTNLDTPFGGIHKIASGGELSRIILGLKIVLCETKFHNTMVFDEIDKGIGGATADIVGLKLKNLAQKGQVLVITHSPQVASKGDAHYHISKHTDENGITRSQINLLDAQHRIEEIARMLSGETVTSEARAAAANLLM